MLRAMARPSPLVLAGLLLAAAAFAEEFKGFATPLNGDTLEIAGMRLRLAGVAAPRLEQTCTREGEEFPCGRMARDALADLVAASAVSCETTGTVLDGLPAVICEAGGFELNGNLVYMGWAVPLPGVSHYDDMRDSARDDGRGVWGGEFVWPWVWVPGE